MCLCQPADSQIRFESEKLADHLYFVQSKAGGNLACCVGDQGILLVDSEYQQLNSALKKVLLKITDKDVKYIVNTHWHFDHVEGNGIFAKEGAMVLAHQNVRQRMEKGQKISIIDREVPASPWEALPKITYQDSMTLYLNKEEIRLFHVPKAHTDGDTLAYFKKANVIHVGDLVFQGGYPFIDISSKGSIDGLIAGIKTAVSLCDENTKVIPGHGALMDRIDLKEYLQMLIDFREVMVGQIEDHKDLETVLKEKPTRELDKKWGKSRFPAQMFMRIVYLSLKEQKS